MLVTSKKKKKNFGVHYLTQLQRMEFSSCVNDLNSRSWLRSLADEVGLAWLGRRFTSYQ